MSGVWKRSPVDETEPPRHTSTLLVLSVIIVHPFWAPTKVFALPIAARLYLNRQGLTKGKKSKGKSAKTTPKAKAKTTPKAKAKAKTIPRPRPRPRPSQGQGQDQDHSQGQGQGQDHSQGQGQGQDHSKAKAKTKTTPKAKTKTTPKAKAETKTTPKAKAKTKTTPKAKADPNHRTRPELALELIRLVARWFPNDEILVLGDSAYGGRSVLSHLPPNVHLISRVHPKAALYQPAPPKAPKTKGAPRKKGDRLPGMAEWANDSQQPWTQLDFDQFGLHAALEVKTMQALYYKSGRDRLLKIVLVRDTQGKRPDQMFYSTKRELRSPNFIEPTAGISASRANKVRASNLPNLRSMACAVPSVEPSSTTITSRSPPT